MTPLRVLETCLYVDDLTAAAWFYGNVLGLPLHSEVAGRHVFFRCGEGMVLLFLAETTNKPGGELPPHGAHGAGHAAFAVPHGEVDAQAHHLTAHGTGIEQEVTWPNGARSLYFRDPAGNSIEIASEGLWHA